MRRHPEFGNSWWAKRWRSVLESFGWSSRLQSGRIYARLGNVTRVVIDKGIVMADVSGSQARPYRVTIKVKTLAVFDWNQVIDKLLERPLFMAKLLAGEMPSDIHEAFSDVHLSLFPDAETDFQTNCSCPDWANPCKHIAAVYYKVGQAFDENPFLIFALRGMGRDRFNSNRFTVCWRYGQARVDTRSVNSRSTSIACAPNPTWFLRVGG